MLRLLIIIGGLKEITPSQVLGDVMTQETYGVERERVDKDNKKEGENNEKKSVAFKASSSSKNKGKSEKESSDDEAMTFFLHMMGKFMKKGYSAIKRRDHTKSKEYVRRHYN
jgi:hypothetical protein